MRMPIVQFPQIVSENFSWFASTFQTKEQQKHFCEYVTGLIAGDKATVAAINALFLNRNDQSALNKFLTQASWDESELNQRRIKYELARLHRRPVSESAGRLIIDDTLAHHTRCSIEGLAYLKDHTLGRNVWAHNVVTSYYVNRSDQFPGHSGSRKLAADSVKSFGIMNGEVVKGIRDKLKILEPDEIDGTVTQSGHSVR